MVAGMSDPVANVDIEDVLSSIRRLVSNGPDRNGDSAQEAGEAERLVLTPSQRVDEADAPAPEDDSVPGNDDVTPGQRFAGSAGVTEAHPPGIDLPPEPETDSGAHDPDGDAPDDMPRTDAEAEGEAALAAVSPDRHGETGSAEDDAAPATGMPDGHADAAEEASGTGGPDETGDPDTLGDDPALDGIAAMFARHDSAAPTTWEPDGDDEDAFADGASSPALDWRDVEETGEDGGRGPDAPEADHPGAADLRDAGRAYAGDRDVGARPAEDNAFAIEDEAVLDEEALRDLVAEIVREELMGTLGERITRNVRKLVRREIHRALNSQDFD